MKSILPLIILGSLVFLSIVPLHAESRAWSNREGKTIQAELVKYDSETKKVTLNLSNGKEVILALDTLSDSDQSWLTDRQGKLDEAATAIRANAGKTVSYQSEGPEAVSYHVYYPTSYNPDSPPAMIILFSPGGGGKGILGSVKDAGSSTSLALQRAKSRAVESLLEVTARRLKEQNV